MATVAIDARTTPIRVERVRDPWLDNARLVAAVAVVLGHCLALLFHQYGPTETVWIATWAIRVPLLVLLAGWFSSAAPLTRPAVAKLGSTLLAVFVVFELLSVLVAAAVPGTEPVELLVPAFGLWFLLSLFCWRLALPFLARIPYLGWWAVAAALLVGFVAAADDRLALSRTVAWFPLFLLGHRLARGGFRARVAAFPHVRAVAVAATVAAAAGCFVVHRLGGVEALRMTDPFVTGAPTPSVELAALRALTLLVAAVGAVAMLVLVPRRRIVAVTVLGAGSLSVYLFHSLLLPPLVGLGAFDHIDSAAEVVATLLVATFVALFLATPRFRRWAEPLLNPVRHASHRRAQARRVR